MTRLLAEDTPFSSVFGKISPPPELSSLTGLPGASGLNIFLSNALRLAYGIGGVIFIFMLVSGAILWILSGGDKEQVAKARGRIIHAIIGIVLLGLTFVIITLLSNILGFQFFGGINPYPEYCQGRIPAPGAVGCH